MHIIIFHRYYKACTHELKIQAEFEVGPVKLFESYAVEVIKKKNLKRNVIKLY